MSEILNEALLAQIKRFKALDLETFKAQVDEQKRVQNHILGVANKINHELEAIQDLTWLKDVKEVKVNHHHRYELNLNGWIFGGLLVACVVSVLWGVWAIKGADSAKKEAYQVREWADFGRYYAESATKEQKDKWIAKYLNRRKKNADNLLFYP